MDEATIIDILKNKKEKIAAIHNKMMILYEELDSETALENAALPPINLSGMPGAKGQHKDLGDVLIRCQKQAYAHNEEIREMMCELVKEEDMINRVWACFHVLKHPYYTILTDLYVNNQLYETVEKAFDYSHKTFEKHRKEGIRLIMDFYDSGEDVSALMRRYRKNVSKKTKKKQQKEPTDSDNCRQMDLKDFMK